MSVILKEGRDLPIIEKFVDLAKIGDSSQEWVDLKKAFAEAGYSALASLKKEDAEVESHCPSLVCYYVACAWNSDCSGGACNQNGCAAGIDADCSGTGTCDSKVCGSGISVDPDDPPTTCTSGKVCGSRMK